MAVAGFCAMTAKRPPRVQSAATSFPTEMSRYWRKPLSFWGQGGGHKQR